MITVTVEDLLGNRLPEAYYQTTHSVYIVRDGSQIIYVGKAERQTVYERLLQHLAEERPSNQFGRSNGPSALGMSILESAPLSGRGSTPPNRGHVHQRFASA